MNKDRVVTLENFDLGITKIVKSRVGFLCDTSEGTKILMPYRGSENRAKELAQTLSYIKSKGVPVEQLYPTREGTYISAEPDDNKYILKDYIKGQECNPMSMEDLTEAAGTIGRYHHAIENYENEGHEEKEDREKNADNIGEKYSKKVRELNKLHNYILRKGRLNDFERLYNKVFDDYYKQALGLKEIIASMEKDFPGKILCHGDCNYHNLIKQKEWLLINYETMVREPAMVDLACFMRKMLEKNSWSVELGRGMLEEYEKYRPMNRDERKLLGYMLMFPEKLWKLANHYMASKKSIVSDKYYEKLKVLLEQEKQKREFLQKIFSIEI